MTRNLLKIALLGLVASFCISAKEASDSQEVAMAKCSRDGRRDQGRSGKCSDREGRYDSRGRYHDDRSGRYYDDRRARPARENEERQYRDGNYDNRNVRDNRYYNDRGDDRYYEDRNCRDGRCYEDRCEEGRCSQYRPSTERCNTIDSAGRQRCYSGDNTRVYENCGQKDCDKRGNCTESTETTELRINEAPPARTSALSEITVKRKSAAQKVLEGY